MSELIPVQPEEGTTLAEEHGITLPLAETHTVASEDESLFDGIDFHEGDETDPSVRVEAFLQEYGDDFAAARHDWRIAQTIQKSQKDAPFKDTVRSVTNRDQRRQGPIRKAMKYGMGSIFDSLRKNAIDWGQDYAAKDNLSLPKEERLARFEAALNATEYQQAYGQAQSEMEQVRNLRLTPTLPGAQPQIEWREENLFPPLARAIYQDGVNQRRLAEFIKDPAVVMPLLGRLQELAGTQHQREFPGLLEAVAIYNRSAQLSDSIFLDGIKRAHADPMVFAEDFLTSVIAEGTNPYEKKLSQQASIASAMTRLLFETDDAAMAWKSEVYERLLAKTADWPKWLSTEMTSYTEARVKSLFNAFAKDLDPFVHEPRLRQLHIKEEKPHRTELKNRIVHTMPEPAPLISTTSVENRVRENEKKEAEPITRLGVLKGIGSNSKRNIRRFEEVDDIDALMALKPFTTYFDKYKGEKGLAEMVRSALTLLTTDPYNRTHTQAHTGVSFELEGELGKKLKVHRFSLQRREGVEAFSVTAGTRIFYSVAREGGKDVLVFFGPAHKNKTNKIGTNMPRIN